MKTLVMPKHKPGPMENGGDGCHARFGNKGMCPGIETAEWLNGLGDDDALYGHSTRITNGDVRRNWLKNSDHIKRVSAERA